ncbi:TAXI family TRAP transporter solute-binding subunit [Roseospira visakhapatnamensis]|uniref:TAXI family TRAP transporter solute-binding subunit n=1 Tax=Roseospira visakhapatnamensis TaxID=390880 RepID=A0A7W6R9X6_9PROT|nr:TAXI family TRAP transporter solute-binding subunit [Roseospira visakhapatnamensis]MBB4264655.1 hypothetical protein [Roseospira visakhapatnamensis]
MGVIRTGAVGASGTDGRSVERWSDDRRRLVGLLGRAGLLLAAGGAGLLGPSTGPGGARAQDVDIGSAADLRFLRIGTGSTSGTYFPIGGLIASAISRPPGSRPCEKGGSCGVPGLIAVALSTNGSVENMHLLASGALGMAFSQSDVAFWARAGAGVFREAGPMPNLVALARLYDEALHLVVRADGPLTRVEDLRGMRVGMGEEGSGTLVDARQLLIAHGLTEADLLPVFEKPGPSADLLVAGEIDAFFFIGAPPVTVVREVAEAMPVRVVPLAGPAIERMVRNHPFLSTSVIPAGTYANNPAPIHTVSVGAVLTTVTDALDEATAHGVARAMWHPSVRGLFQQTPAGDLLIPSRAPHGTGIPLHPGARRYYQESGYWP